MSVTMKLTTYCENSGGTGLRGCPVLARIADEAKCSAETLYMVAKGHKQPSSLLARRISDSTHGAVPREALRPDVFGAPNTAHEAAANE
ncbi:helix-turn-helix domain-containing protein [Luteibacter aegosomaticola]|uniref:helix-turn-helix domain-containing protein n=1 Tax=Luteibacter aegosomaticola TaxID=2911538 RepID=UPI001FF907EE|nr:helix-turn-helix domain-containing protein [Luteibacter aegosomaticola]UPG89300.1 helix-turn-helix domain-containing protein [Luteibacter aegosomaticola]